MTRHCYVTWNLGSRRDWNYSVPGHLSHTSQWLPSPVRLDCVRAPSYLQTKGKGTEFWKPYTIPTELSLPSGKSQSLLSLQRRERCQFRRLTRCFELGHNVPTGQVFKVQWWSLWHTVKLWRGAACWEEARTMEPWPGGGLWDPTPSCLSLCFLGTVRWVVLFCCVLSAVVFWCSMTVPQTMELVTMDQNVWHQRPNKWFFL